MKYVIPLFLLVLISAFGCKKGNDTQAPPKKDSVVTPPKDSTAPGYPTKRTYVGIYTNREIYDDAAAPLYSLDTNFRDTLFATFTDSSFVQCKVYTYTIFHSLQDPATPFPPAGRDSLVFSCRIEYPSTNLQQLKVPIRGGSISFSVDRQTVSFERRYASGGSHYLHYSSFNGNKIQ
jgi:hypothetical protein